VTILDYKGAIQGYKLTAVYRTDAVSVLKSAQAWPQRAQDGQTFRSPTRTMIPYLSTGLLDNG